MIPEKSTVEKSGNIAGDVARMSIDEAAMAHIMSVLTNLYSDPELAIIREYTTNAHDAQVEAGYTGPIEVVTPTSLAPFLKIKDHGIGMTVDDIHAIYSKYGASTKRGRNDQVGMLGLGCKSALTYADQFTVTSVKGGTRIAISISRDEDGGGSMTVVDSSATDEPDGTEIAIPAKRMNELQRKAEAFFRFWPEGSVLLNGRPPERFDGLRVTETLWLMDGSRDSKIVMGNVAYPAPQADLAFVASGCALIAFVPIGAVTFPPARESLMMTRNTKETLAAIEWDYAANINAAVQTAVDAQPDEPAALATALRWRAHIRGNVKYTYKGATLPTEYTPHDPQGSGVTVSRSYSYRVGESYRARAIGVGSWPSTVWITDFEPGTFSAPHKRKMQKYIEDGGITDVAYFVMLRDHDPAPDPVWIDADHVVPWATIKAIKLPANTGAGSPQKAIRGSFYGFIGGQRVEEIVGKDIDRNLPIFYVQGPKWTGRRYAEQLEVLYPGCTLLVLPANRVTKFKRDVPEAKTYGQGIDEAYTAWNNALTDDDRLRLVIEDFGHRYHLSGDLAALDATRVDDPALKEAIRLANLPVNGLLAKRQAVGGQRAARPNWTNPLAKYPLFDRSVLRSKPDHHYTYLNAAYAAERENA